jgi:hypothetical protein
VVIFRKGYVSIESKDGKYCSGVGHGIEQQLLPSHDEKISKNPMFFCPECITDGKEMQRWNLAFQWDKDNAPP